MVTEDGRMIVVGCNYGAGQLIKLFPGAVNDPALLAAHEFGHNWYGHSFNDCASWAHPPGTTPVASALTAISDR